MTAVSPLPPQPSSSRWRAIWPLGLILLAVLLVYGQTAQFEFINYDDDVHVYANRNVRSGISWENFLWAFGIHGPSQWHPLAWLSHQLDSQLFGADAGTGAAGGHHLVNVLLHAASTLAAFFVFGRMTGSRLGATFVAGMFALHPLNVESVAWVSERRNTLCGLFFMLALLAYLDYATRPRLWRYLAVCLLFAGGLMAKPMLVTFPCLLLLLDYWPLDRLRPAPRNSPASPAPAVARPWRLLAEKVPLLLLSAIASYLTILCQERAGVISSTEALPISIRIANAFAAYGHYLKTILWPTGLSVFYPHPGLVDADPWRALHVPAAIGLLLVAAGSGVAAACVRRRPVVFVGWFWFLGLLVPMIGLVQVGEQQYADRYTYLASLGLFLIVGTLLGRCEDRLRVDRKWLVGAVAVSLTAFTARSFVQTAMWRDSLTLFHHALVVNPRNHYAYLNVGVALAEAGETTAAIEAYEAALRVRPEYALAHYNLGVLLHDRGDFSAAARHYDAALRNAPAMADAWVRLGVLNGDLGQLQLAEQRFRQALAVDPANDAAHVNLALVLEHFGETRAAVEHFQSALRLSPGDARARAGLERIRSKVN